MTIHRVPMCRCGHDLHDGQPCTACGCSRASRRASPVPSTHGGDLSSDVLNDLRRTAHTLELAATIIHGHAKTILAALGKNERRVSRRGVETGRASPSSTAPSGANGLSKCERVILNVLALRRGMSTTRSQLAIMSGYSVQSGGFANALGGLRSGGYVAGLSITDAGFEVAPTDPLPEGRALIDFWMPKLGRCERKIVDVLWGVRPDALTRDGLAERAGYSPDSGGYANALGRLRTLELIERNAPHGGFRLGYAVRGGI
jgi:hypothetical protein